MHLGVNILVVRLPKSGDACDTLSKVYIFQLADCQVKCIFIGTHSGLQQTSLLEQIVFREQF